MRLVRPLILTLGPVLLVGLCYLVAFPHRSDGRGDEGRIQPVAGLSEWERSGQIAACETTAQQLRQTLGEELRLLIRPPFVIGGNLSMAELERLDQDTIQPTVIALRSSYFDQAPIEPITVLIFADEASYRRAAERLDGRAQAAYYGYYDRRHRRLLLNIATGEGTLAHELTHALTHADFPAIPEWFDEGLASLHEECDFSADGLRLIGRPNWRTELLSQAARRDKLRSLESLMSEPYASPGREALDYAHARGFCLYLQERQLLGSFYRKCRARIAADPTGRLALLELLGTESLAPVEADFREWLDGRL